MAGLYIHIPFCAKRCIYCDFFSNTDMGYKESYLQALIKEIEQRKEFLSDPFIETIYFGGGTPSQLSPEDLHQIIENIYNQFEISSNPEITLEVNPDDISENYISALKRLPINRISMGVQSFQDTELQFLNRRHTANQAHKAVKNLQDTGFNNISLDLIYGIPGQSRENWVTNIEQALSLDIPHLSAYHLTYEEGTALYQLKQNNKICIMKEDDSIWAFNHLVDTLSSNGFDHYEISNFGKPGYISRHNSSYWTGKQYLGIGPSAHSYNGIRREWNVSSLPAYLKGIEKGEPDIEHELLDITTCYNDAIITGLRTCWGVNMEIIREKYGDNLADYCLQQAKPYIKDKLIHYTSNTLKLSKSGILISDSIMSNLLFV